MCCVTYLTFYELDVYTPFLLTCLLLHFQMYFLATCFCWHRPWLLVLSVCVDFSLGRWLHPRWQLPVCGLYLIDWVLTCWGSSVNVLGLRLPVTWPGRCYFLWTGKGWGTSYDQKDCVPCFSSHQSCVMAKSGDVAYLAQSGSVGLCCFAVGCSHFACCPTG